MSKNRFLFWGIVVSVALIAVGGFISNVYLILGGFTGFMVFWLLRGGWKVLKDAERQRRIDTRIVTAENCDWCGHYLPRERKYCKECGDVFCGDRCYYEHLKYKHS